MGYRSDVCLCMKKAAINNLEANLTLKNISQMKCVSALLADSDHMIDSESGSELWLWRNIKWYPDYQDISFLESLMSDLNADDYLFIRIGEDSDDNEISGSFQDNPFGLYLSRQICFERP